MNDDAMETMMETLDEEGEVVFAVGWHSGGPGAGADSEKVFRCGTEYWLWLSQGELQGPFETLLADINHYGLFKANPGNDFYSTELTSEEITSRLEPMDPPGVKVYINEEYWKLGDDGKFACHPDPYAGVK